MQDAALVFTLVRARISDSDKKYSDSDTSASAIAICGILEMAKYLEKENAQVYLAAADRMLKALTDICVNKDCKKSNGLLLHGTYARNSKENTCINRGVDECNTWGDYFYMEALTRLSKDWELYW